MIMASGHQAWVGAGLMGCPCGHQWVLLLFPHAPHALEWVVCVGNLSLPIIPSVQSEGVAEWLLIMQLQGMFSTVSTMFYW